MVKSFVAILQDTLSPEDSKWEYFVPNLPQSQHTNQAGFIKCVSVVSSTAKQRITLRYEIAPANRVTKNDLLDRFVLLSFADFRLQWPTVTAGQASKPATGKENGDYIARMLVKGITINGIQYHFYGHSNSQLKSRSCFAYAGTKAEISAKIEAMGDLSKLKSVGKKAKRIGLLFSSAEVSLTLSPDRCEDIDDIATKDYIFTDGCGLVSMSLMKHIAQKRNIVFRDRRYLPAVVQIRYRGYKGVLTLDPTLRGQIQAQFRTSMRKFKDSPDLSFAAVDYSKPYTFGSLNDEVVVLLHTLGISQETLLSKQAQYLKFLENVQNGDYRAAFQFLSYIGRVELAEKLLLHGLSSMHATLKSLVKQEHAKMINKRDERRCRILIPKSRLLFGVCDPTAKNGFAGRLKEGECFVRITQDGDGRAHTIINTEVLVTRNPCLHPGDLQKFEAVDMPEFAHLVDCIVFSARGERPSADLMSGGDLDGDKFLVTWDSDIIPRTMSEPALYPGGKEPITFGAVTGDSRAEYFARYTNASLGRTKNLYMKWARLGNAMSPQCQQLNRLFSQCVDGNNIKIPKNLEDPPEPDPTVAPFILDVLHDACTEQIGHASDLQPEMHDDPHIMDMLVSRDKMAMSEFELLQATLRWCEKYDIDIMAYYHAFDFSALTDEQKIWLLSRLPPTVTAPSLVRNGLLQSQLLTPLECRRFGLDHPQLRWKPVFSSSMDRMARFLPVVCRSLETFHKKLIVLNINERLSIAIYVPHKIARASEVPVNDTVRVFALPHSEGEQSANYRVMPTRMTYRLYCDDHAFQLYQAKRGNTWIFLRSSKGDDASYRTLTSKSAKRSMREHTLHEKINFDCLASVALDKISKAIQTHAGKVQAEGVLGAEVYVISNRDVASMKVLDQWLHYIDTEEVLPLFEKTEHEYMTPKLSMVDWSEHSDFIQNICKDNNLSQLRQLKTVKQLEGVLNLLRKYNERVRLRDVFSEVVLLASDPEFPLQGRSIVSSLLNYLPDAPYLTSILLQSHLWKQHKEVVEHDLVTLAPMIAKKLVLVSNELRGIARQTLSCLMQEVKQVSLQNFAELVELIALTIRSPEAALDLFLETLEPETPRLLLGRPAAIRQFVSSLFGVALDHIDEAASGLKPEDETIQLTFHDYKDGYAIVKSEMRIDSSMNGMLKVGDHARLTVTNPPENDPCAKPLSMDVLVLDAQPGAVTFRCLHDTPSYLADCAWSVTLSGSFVTSKTCFDAVTTFYTQREACCRIYASILGLQDTDQIELPNVELPVVPESTLNESQNDALVAAMRHSMTLIWGPPGTGKTHTIIVILCQLLRQLPKSRFLVTAPTHNAVDNILRRFANDKDAKGLGVAAVRVSTQLSKVSQDLRQYTCDAMLGKDLTGNLPARRKAQKRIKEARLIFTTCIGASLGLLRDETFDVVVVDEASQQTEPATLVPLVKGCSRAILVGDHVQLRATVQKNAILTGFDISLFERHYNMPTREGVAKAMLDTQYRMHRNICDFSSNEFYQGKLKTQVPDDSRPLLTPQFPWPKDNRMVWVECSGMEDLGRQSKANQGQVQVCKRIVGLLTSSGSTAMPKASQSPQPSIVVLTPYTRQREALSSAIPSVEVSSIDGFQGREADIVVFVTVRCNASNDIGFLADMRRLNVVMTRAKCGVVIIGNKSTLVGGIGGGGDLDESKLVWKRLIERCAVAEIEDDTMSKPASA